MNERDVLLGILGIVKRHVNVDSVYGADVGLAEMESRIKAMPASEFPIARKAILEAREELVKSQDLRESLVRLVRVYSDLAKISGFQKGMAVGVVRDWTEQPENWPTLIKTCEETLAFVDAAGLPKS